MIRINLISDKEKEERIVDKKIGAIIRLGFAAFFSLLVLSSIMFSALAVLGINLDSVKEESKTYPASSVKEIQATEELLKSINEISKKIGKDSQDIPHWGKIVKRISENCPEELKITGIHAEKEHMKITGFAKTRESFLAFQEKLKEGGFKNLNSPVSNLVSPKDFSFTVEVDVESGYLSNP